MQRLLAGYARFRDTVFPKHKAHFETLAKGQQPDALFITCSDSRVMPELILQSGPGEIFPIRLAGNLVPPPGDDPSGIAATIEYAVRVLKVKDVIVCGHTHCGAMKELLEQAHTEDLPVVTSWLRHAGPSAAWLRGMFKANHAHSSEQQLQLITESNVVAQLEHLRQHAAVRDALRAGELNLHGWIYDITKGELTSFNAEDGKFHAIAPTHNELEIAAERKVA